MAHNTDKTGWSANLYNKNAPFVYSNVFTAPVLQMLSPQAGEKIIDFGCGSGEVTLELEKIVKEKEGGRVVGVDFSESMITQARVRGLEHAYVADIQDLPDLPIGADVKFDAMFTNAALHWCKRDPRGVLQSAKRVLKPGGRIAGEMGGFMNCIGIRGALYKALKTRGYDAGAMDPWYFPSVEDYTEILKAESFEPIEVTLTPRVTALPAGVFGWLAVFVRPMILKDFSDEEATEIMKEVEETCRIDCQDSQGRWQMMYMRLRFSAVWKQ
ncbi:cyclopropane-fatty-acyl-phospholipid synthase [Armillaria solidipes]|uniref:Cyclopropane-fatty-acyl-phospholipid synthase n=1 Tax=Armillaria solidipes TaxID=1076256 RepID=A0A2H3CER4_9AGAR|nr:cyclopropane-fatty-acyl-phospholipid synthase [Armillaria solidipes]